MFPARVRYSVAAHGASIHCSQDFQIDPPKSALAVFRGGTSWLRSQFQGISSPIVQKVKGKQSEACAMVCILICLAKICNSFFQQRK